MNQSSADLKTIANNFCKRVDMIAKNDQCESDFGE